jgi:hypothetical protein
MSLEGLMILRTSHENATNLEESEHFGPDRERNEAETYSWKQRKGEGKVNVPEYP